MAPGGRPKHRRPMPVVFFSGANGNAPALARRRGRPGAGIAAQMGWRYFCSIFSGSTIAPQRTRGQSGNISSSPASPNPRLPCRMPCPNPIKSKSAPEKGPNVRPPIPWSIASEETEDPPPTMGRKLLPPTSPGPVDRQRPRPLHPTPASRPHWWIGLGYTLGKV